MSKGETGNDFSRSNLTIEFTSSSYCCFVFLFLFLSTSKITQNVQNLSVSFQTKIRTHGSISPEDLCPHHTPQDLTLWDPCTRSTTLIWTVHLIYLVETNWYEKNQFNRTLIDTLIIRVFCYILNHQFKICIYCPFYKTRHDLLVCLTISNQIKFSLTFLSRRDWGEQFEPLSLVLWSPQRRVLRGVWWGWMPWTQYSSRRPIISKILRQRHSH